MRYWILLVCLPLCVSGQGWWDLYDNPTLSEWVEQGLAAHPDPQVALASIAASRAVLQGVRADGRPKSELRVGVRTGRENTMYTDRRAGDSDPFFATAGFRWELDLRGRIKAAASEAEAGIQAAESDLEAVRLLLAGEIIGNCIDRDLYRKQLLIENKKLSLQKRRVDSYNARVEAGLMASNNLELHKAQLTVIQQQTVTLQGRLEKSEARLHRLVGDKAPAAYPDFSELPLHKLEPDLQTDQLLQRPDVARAWWHLQESVARVSVHQKDRYPTLALVASAGAEAKNRDNVEPWHAWVGPVVSIPVFAPDTTAKQSRSRAERQNAKARFQSVSLIALREMDDSRIELQQSKQLLNLSQERVRSFEVVEASQQRKREAGLIQQVALIASTLQTYEAEQDRQYAESQLLRSHLNWQLAIGAP